jgi:hypothetical protein
MLSSQVQAEWLDVDSDVLYARHRKKEGKPDSVKVTYYCWPDGRLVSGYAQITGGMLQSRYTGTQGRLWVHSDANSNTTGS